MNMPTKRIVAVAALFAATPLATPSIGVAADRIVFGTDWRARAERGGFYQALATGLHRDRGLDGSTPPRQRRESAEAGAD